MIGMSITEYSLWLHSGIPP